MTHDMKKSDSIHAIKAETYENRHKRRVTIMPKAQGK